LQSASPATSTRFEFGFHDRPALKAEAVGI